MCSFWALYTIHMRYRITSLIAFLLITKYLEYHLNTISHEINVMPFAITISETTDERVNHINY